VSGDRFVVADSGVSATVVEPSRRVAKTIVTATAASAVTTSATSPAIRKRRRRGLPG
jgi:hypothetical protein